MIRSRDPGHGAPRRAPTVRRRAALARALAAALTAALAAAPALAAGELDDIERRLPRRERPSQEAPPPAAPSVAAPRSDVGARAFVLAAVAIEGATAVSPDELAPAYESYLTRPVAADDIVAIADAVTRIYRAKGYVLSRAVIPAQSGAGGVVRLQMVEGRIDEVVIEGAQSAAARRRLEAVLADRPLRAATLERALALIGDLPGVTVAASRLEPDVDDLASHRLVVTLERRRVEGWAYADNRGVGDAGDAQAYLSTSLNTLLREGDRASFGVFAALENPEQLLFGEAGYELPLGASGTTLGLHGWSSHAEAGATLTTPDVETESRSVVVRIAHPFIRGRSFTLRGDAGVEVRSLQERRDAAMSFEDELRIIDAGLNAVRANAHAQTTFDLRLRAGVEAFGASTGGTGPLSRPDADGEFVKLNLFASRYHDVGRDLGVYGAVTAQVSSDPLLASEEFTYGGAQFGRAYDYAAIAGDDGAAASLELRYGRDPHLEGFSFAQLYAFYDAGWVWGRDGSSAPRHAGLSSTGLGLRLTARNDARLSFEAAKPLSRVGGADHDAGWRGFLALSSDF